MMPLWKWDFQCSVFGGVSIELVGVGVCKRAELTGAMNSADSKSDSTLTLTLEVTGGQVPLNMPTPMELWKSLSSFFSLVN